MNYSQGLNKPQLEAVKAPMGPILILAGAGSGKTKALTMRIVFLIKKLGLKPNEILAVTFTNKAAGEMKDRIKKMLGKDSSLLPIMGTFHSIGAKILRAESKYFGLTASFVIYDNQDQESLLKDILIKLRFDPTKYKPSLFANIIDRAKNNLVEPTDWGDDDKKFNKMAHQVFSVYKTEMQKNNAVDFGDLITLPVYLFQKHPEVLKKYQKLWKYILVDEYQDTNHAQYIFTKLLAKSHQNIFVVGDDAQAIYGFRGANLQNILDYEKDYPEAQVIRLEQNYRSTAQILSVAEKIIELSPRQHKKKLWTENTEGKTPVLFSAQDEQEEAYFVAATIIKLQDQPRSAEGGRGEAGGKSEELEYIPEDLSAVALAKEDETILGRIMRQASSRILPKLRNRRGLNNIAVLYRTHAQSRVLEEAFIESRIPYQIIGGLKFYERKEIKDIIAYLRLLINPNDLVSLKRVVNVPPRGIGPKSLDLLKQSLLERNKKALGKLFSDKPAIKSFFEILDTLSKLDPQATLSDILGQVLKLTGYEHFLRDGTEEGESRFENVQELFNVAGSFRNFPWTEGLNKFLEEAALMTNVDELDLNSPKVTLMTLHQAKGLEFDTVFLVGLEEGLLPHARSILESKEISEEIRLAYVGVTRAKKHLYLVHALSRKQFGMRNASLPSRILKAIPKELLDILHNF